MMHFTVMREWQCEPHSLSDLLCVQVLGEKIRLFGLDAPEKAQSCSDQEGRAYACGESSGTQPSPLHTLLYQCVTCA